MTAIRAIFDGKAFVPEQPIALPTRTEATVIVNQADSAAQASLDSAVRAYYQQGKEDADDAAWSSALAAQSDRAWTED